MKSSEVSHRRVRLLCFIPNLGDGGAQTHLIRLVNSLDRDAFDTTVVSGRKGGVHESSLAGHISLQYLLETRRSWWPVDVMRWVLPLRRLISTTRPDIVLSILDHANCAALLAAQGLPNRPKVVSVVQTPLSVHYGQLPFAKRVYALTWIKSMYPKSDLIIACSRGALEDVSKSIPGLGGRLRFVYNCIDTPGALPAVPRAPDSSPLVVACGRLSKQKGFDLLLHAMTILRRKMPVRLRIIGEGEDRAKLEKLRSQLSLEQCVEMPGFTTNVLEEVAAGNVFALSSVWEAFGNVIVEAMSCGTPVVASDCPYGPAEIITHGVNGLLFRSGSVEEMAASIEHVLNDGDLARRLSAAALVRARDFRSPVIARQYQRILFEMVGH